MNITRNGHNPRDTAMEKLFIRHSWISCTWQESSYLERLKPARILRKPYPLKCLFRPKEDVVKGGEGLAALDNFD